MTRKACFPLAHIGLLLAAAVGSGLGHAQTPASPALVGQWKIETAVGTTTLNGVSTDDMGEGLLTIRQIRNGLAGTISWLNEQGRVTSARQVLGHADGTRVVLTQSGQRVISGRDGGDVTRDVTIRWTLQASGSRLSGERLVETDEDEPKPVSGTRVAARDVLPAAALLPLRAAARDSDPKPERGPSTPSERARVLQMALDAGHDPLRIQQRDGAWLENWVNEVPDLELDYGTAFAWIGAAANADIRAALAFQYTASAMALQIRDPQLAGQQAAVELAGMEGVLHAYEGLVHQDSTHASPRLDQALAARDKKQLPAFLTALSGRDPLLRAFAVPGPAATSDPVVRRILTLGRDDPHAMAWLDILSNRFGGRMTGSDAYTHAAAWMRTQLSQWAVQAELEEAGSRSVGFNRGPWSGRMLMPVDQPLRIATPAYTAGTKGVQRGLVALGSATLDEAQARAAEFKDKWVLIGGVSTGSGRDGEYQYKPRAIMRTLATAGALGTIQSGEEPLYSGAAGPATWDSLPTLPDIKLAQAQYTDIRSQVAAGQPVTLEFDIHNWFYPGPVTYHNVVARIPGTEKPEEIVLLGAHLDSFDGATGAADNGSGVATMMEVMRLLAASGERPRRTILMVAFAAEENGLKGSSAFAERHADQMPGVVMMLNRDSRPGAISSIGIPSAWQSVFTRVEDDLRGVHPVFDFHAVIDDSPVRASSGAGASSDDRVFAEKGILVPKFSALGDFDYQRVHHTVADTYENILPFRSAQQYSAMAIAIIAHEVANAPDGVGRQQSKKGVRYIFP